MICFVGVYISQFFLLYVIVRSVITPSKANVDATYKRAGFRDFLANELSSEELTEFFEDGGVDSHVLMLGKMDPAVGVDRIFRRRWCGQSRLDVGQDGSRGRSWPNFSRTGGGAATS